MYFYSLGQLEIHFIRKTSCVQSELSQAGGWGGFSTLQFLAKQLTLSQPGGQIMPTTVLQAPLV